MVLGLIAGINLYNLGILFIFVFLSSVGFPGGLVSLVSLGAISRNFGELFVVIIVACIAAILGDIFVYEVARKFLPKLVKKLRRFKFFKNSEREIKIIMKDYEFSLVFLTRFAIVGICAAVSYIAGIEKLNRKKFYSAVILGEILYGSIYPLIGFLFKEAWTDVVSMIEDLFIIAIIILVLFIISKIAFRKKRAKIK